MRSSRGKRGPAILEQRPQINELEQQCLDCYLDLATTRQIGFGMSPIAPSEFRAWCWIASVGPRRRAWLWQVVHSVDLAMMEDRNDAHGRDRNRQQEGQARRS